jgi:TetR/AcrR family transcriptional repressor of nem operon
LYNDSEACDPPGVISDRASADSVAMSASAPVEGCATLTLLSLGRRDDRVRKFHRARRLDVKYVRPYYFAVARHSLREKLLDAGVQVLWTAGYAQTGVRDIVAAAGARPGSFTNHFASKEDFALEVLERYFAYVRGLVSQALTDDGRPAVERLRRYFDIITLKLEEAEWARGCLIGNFSLETAVLSDRLQQRLAAIFLEWRAPFAACIAEGQASGAITTAFSADDLADFLLAGWQGAMLRMRVDRSPAPLDRFKHIVFTTIFTEASS